MILYYVTIIKYVHNRGNDMFLTKWLNVFSCSAAFLIRNQATICYDRPHFSLKFSAELISI